MLGRAAPASEGDTDAEESHGVPDVDNEVWCGVRDQEEESRGRNQQEDADGPRVDIGIEARSAERGERYEHRRDDHGRKDGECFGQGYSDDLCRDAVQNDRGPPDG